jgi:hypothetical protein
MHKIELNHNRLTRDRYPELFDEIGFARLLRHNRTIITTRSVSDEGVTLDGVFFVKGGTIEGTVFA